MDAFYRYYFACAVWVTLSFQWPRLVRDIPEPVPKNIEKLLGSDKLLALSLLGQQTLWPEAILKELIDRAAKEDNESMQDFRLKREVCVFLGKCAQAWDAYFETELAEVEETEPTEFVESDTVVVGPGAKDPDDVLRRWTEMPEPHELSEFLDDLRGALLSPEFSSSMVMEFHSKIDFALRIARPEDHSQLVRIFQLLAKHGAVSRADRFFKLAEKREFFGHRTPESRKLTGDYVSFLINEIGDQAGSTRARKWLNSYRSELAESKGDADLLPLAIAAVQYGQRHGRSPWRRMGEKLVSGYVDRAMDTKSAPEARAAVRILRAANEFTVQRWEWLNPKGTPHQDPTLLWLAAEGFRHGKDIKKVQLAINLYEDLRTTPLWMPSVIHNLALLHLRNENRPRAIELWEGLYRDDYRDARMQRAFSRELDKLGRKRDASMVSSGKDLEGAYEGPALHRKPESEVEL